MVQKSKREQQAKRRAAKAGLTYVNPFDEGIARRRCGRGFTFIGADGKTVRAAPTRERIRRLAVPPAWEEVWICPHGDGHIQARGRDEAGRTQYVYHADWRTVSDAAKFDRMARFAQVLPRVRRRVRKDLDLPGLPKEKVCAAIIRLLDKARLRIGNARSEKARGATTLEPEDVSLDGFRVSLDFPGKSGQRREVEFSDPKVARVVAQCEEIDGHYLFCFVDGGGDDCRIDSTAVNRRLHEIADEQVTAKDFRTWWGSVTALAALKDLLPEATRSERIRASRAAVKAAAAELGNTVAVCRKSYVHPGLLAAAESGELPGLVAKAKADPVSDLTQDEALFNALLPRLDFT